MSVKNMIAVAEDKLLKLSCEYSVTPVSESFDFGVEKENKEYLKRFEDGFLSSFDLALWQYNFFSREWIIIESLSSVHAVDVYAAIEEFFETFPEETKKNWATV